MQFVTDKKLEILCIASFLHYYNFEIGNNKFEKSDNYIIMIQQLITLVNTQIFATDIISILGYIRCVDFENGIHFC